MNTVEELQAKIDVLELKLKAVELVFQGEPDQALNNIKAQGIEEAIDSISENLSVYDVCADAIGEMHDYADKLRKG